MSDGPRTQFDGKVHTLKTFPLYFDQIEKGFKTFEIREDDGRDFEPGDVLRLVESIPNEAPTGRTLDVGVTYITDYAQKPNYVVMSIVRIPATLSIDALASAVIEAAREYLLGIEGFHEEDAFEEVSKALAAYDKAKGVQQ